MIMLSLSSIYESVKDLSSCVANMTSISGFPHIYVPIMGTLSHFYSTMINEVIHPSNSVQRILISLLALLVSIALLPDLLEELKMKFLNRGKNQKPSTTIKNGTSSAFTNHTPTISIPTDSPHQVLASPPSLHIRKNSNMSVNVMTPTSTVHTLTNGSMNHAHGSNTVSAATTPFNFQSASVIPANSIASPDGSDRLNALSATLSRQLSDTRRKPSEDMDREYDSRLRHNRSNSASASPTPSSNSYGRSSYPQSTTPKTITPASEKEEPVFPYLRPDDFVWKLARGCDMLKYGRYGDPHLRKVRGITKNEKAYLDWGTGNLALSDVTEVIAGKNTSTFRKPNNAQKAAADSLCFSVVTRKRTLDLQVESTIQRDEWVNGLRELTQTLPRNTMYHLPRLSTTGQIADFQPPSPSLSGVSRTQPSYTEAPTPSLLGRASSGSNTPSVVAPTSNSTKPSGLPPQHQKLAAATLTLHQGGHSRSTSRIDPMVGSDPFHGRHPSYDSTSRFPNHSRAPSYRESVSTQIW